MKTIRLRGEEYAQYMQNVDGYRRKLEKSYFDAFGAFRFTSPNGRLIGKPVREDPGVGFDSEVAPEAREAVSDERMASEAEHIKRQRNSGLVQRAPNPRSCKCKDWPTDNGVEREYDAAGKLKHHHPKCAWDKMYRRSTGTQIKNVAAGPTLESKIHHAGKVTNTAKVSPQALGKPSSTTERTKPKVNGVPRPESCAKCKDFTKNRQARAEEEKLGVVLHHPTCDHYKKHKALALAQKATGVKPEPTVTASVSKQKVMLWDLTSQEAVRRAEPYEVETARKRLRDEGVALCEVDGNDYLVAFEDGESLEPAEPEQPPVIDAHSDTEPPGPDNEEASDEPEAEEEPAPLL